MAVEFHLPDIGEGIAEAEIVRWHVAVGDRVVEDQTVAEVETDKAVVEMPAPASGIVTRLGADEGAVVRVDELFIVIDDGADGAVSTEGGTATAAQADPAAPTTPATEAPHGGGNGAVSHRRPMATPATRRRARELAVDLATVSGTGPGGRIVDADVEAAASGPSPGASSAAAARRSGVAPAPAPTTPAANRDDERVPLRGLRRRTTETMTQAWRSIPHTVGFHDVDAVELLTLRARLKARAEQAGIPLTLTPFLVKAAAVALVRHPMVNTAFDEAAQEIVIRHRRNIGVAVSTHDGLIVPVVRDADRKSLFAIAREVAALSAAARDRSVDLADLRGGTFTITNHGPLGGHFGTSIIKPPEAGILGFGRARDQAVVRDGQVVARAILPMSFASDHRIVDGDLSIGFCLTVRELLEDPVQLLVEGG